MIPIPWYVGGVEIRRLQKVSVQNIEQTPICHRLGSAPVVVPLIIDESVLIPDG